MTDFLTRVELHDATSADYEALDLAMAGAHFATSIRSAQGVDYKMPAATYFSQSFNMSAVEVRNAAMVAVRTTGLRYDIVTTSGEMAYFLHPQR
jgi:hypothetical protein